MLGLGVYAGLAGAQAQTITFSPTSITFSDQEVGTTSQGGYLLVAHNGSQPVTISSVSVTGSNAADFAIGYSNCVNAVLVENGSCYLMVDFTPGAPGARCRDVRAS